MKIALISCNNGLGHLRRLVSLSLFLKKKKLQPTLFAQKNKILKLINLKKFKSLSVYEYKSKTSMKNLINGEAYNWEKKLPKLDIFEIIISDNLPDILNIRKDAILSGSFFWHDTLENINKKIKKKHLNLISKYNPTIVHSSLFAYKDMKKYKNIFKVGLFKLNNINKQKNRKKIKKDLLLSIGLGGNLNNDYNIKLINYLIANKTVFRFDNLWVEPKIYKKSMPKFVKKANYTNQMFRALKLAIVRPGIGTVTELIFNKVPIFCIHEKDNKEMIFNSKIISKNYFGYDFKSISKTKKLISDFLINENKLIFYKQYKKISFSGNEDFYKVIKNKINEKYKYRNN